MESTKQEIKETQVSEDWGACDIDEELEACEDPTAESHTSASGVAGRNIEFAIGDNSTSISTTALVVVAIIVIVAAAALTILLNKRK